MKTWHRWYVLIRNDGVAYQAVKDLSYKVPDGYECVTVYAQSSEQALTEAETGWKQGKWRDTSISRTVQEGSDTPPK